MPDPTDQKTYTLTPIHSSNGFWYWRMTAANNKIVADGAEPYSSKASCVKAINRIITANLVVNTSGLIASTSR